MTMQAGAQGAERIGQTGYGWSGLGPRALLVLALPFFVCACASTGSGASTASLAEKPLPGATDAFGYAPAPILAFSDGSRVALPTAKPDHARLAAAEAAAAATAKKAPGSAKAAAPEDAAASLVALKADVAERKAQQASLAIEATSAGKRVMPSAEMMADGADIPLASAVPVPESRKIVAEKPVVEAATEAVAQKIAAVGDSAEAVTVAAIGTTKAAVKVVGEKLGDTFKGVDTITGDAGIDRLIEAAAAENDIPAELAYAVVRVESHYNPRALGSGVYGLSQIKPATARGLGFSGPANALLDPETNLRYGMKYLAGAWQKGDRDVCRTAMKYKGGHRTTRMSRSAASYCSNVKRHMAAIERRRAPANRGVVIAGAERRKQIAAASSASGPTAAAGVMAASAPTGTPGVSAGLAAVAASADGARVAGAAPGNRASRTEARATSANAGVERGEGAARSPR